MFASLHIAAIIFLSTINYTLYPPVDVAIVWHAGTSLAVKPLVAHYGADFFSAHRGRSF